MFISATIVREISVMGGDVRKFVPPLVARRLKAKIAQLGGS
jgi:pantetheine-phosphate adenylyltransferase